MFKIFLILYIISIIISCGLAIPDGGDNCNDRIVPIIGLSLYGPVFIFVYIWCLLDGTSKFNGFRYWNKKKKNKDSKFEPVIIIDLTK